jgi:hypothetical protein
MLLRRTRHVASIAALLLLMIAVGLAQPLPPQTPAGEPTSESKGPPKREEPDNTTNLQQPPQPLTITVTTPPKSATELQQQAADRQREIEATAQQNVYTGLLVLITAITAAVVGWQAWETQSRERCH